MIRVAVGGYVLVLINSRDTTANIPILRMVTPDLQERVVSLPRWRSFKIRRDTPGALAKYMFDETRIAVWNKSKEKNQWRGDFVFMLLIPDEVWDVFDAMCQIEGII